MLSIKRTIRIGIRVLIPAITLIALVAAVGFSIYARLFVVQPERVGIYVDPVQVNLGPYAECDPFYEVVDGTSLSLDPPFSMHFSDARVALRVKESLPFTVTLRIDPTFAVSMTGRDNDVIQPTLSGQETMVVQFSTTVPSRIK